MGFGLENGLIRDVFSNQKMRRIFDDKAMLQGWLDAERSLAEAQGELGVIPAKAAEEIAAQCDGALYDMDKIGAEILKTGHPLVPLIRALVTKSGEAGRYVHWGATTQDIVDTGIVLQAREGLRLLRAEIGVVLRQLVQVARDHRDQPMVGRTHFQHAAPITFGKKVAIWIDDLTRLHDRMGAVEAGMAGQFAGAVGTLAALNGQGAETRDAMCQRLGLESPDVPWHTSRDRIRQIVSVLLDYAAAAERIGAEVVLMQSTEAQEASEPISKTHVGSSTMPQKRNPHSCEFMIIGARAMRGAALPLLTHSVHTHERDMASWGLEWIEIPNLFCLASGLAQHLEHITDGLVVSSDGMAKVLEQTRGLLMSEAAMMALAAHLGHETAHEILYECANEVTRTGRSLKEVLGEDQRILEFMAAEDLDTVLDPASYLGESGLIVDAAIGRAERVI